MIGLNFSENRAVALIFLFFSFENIVFRAFLIFDADVPCLHLWLIHQGDSYEKRE